jgi:hypothetical protein
MIKQKYPSIAELKAQGYPSPQKIEQDRRAALRSQKHARDAAKREREGRIVDALVAHVSAPMRRNDHTGVENALQDVCDYLNMNHR